MTVDLQDQLGELCAVIDEEQGRIREHDVRTHSDAVMVVGGTSSAAPPTIRRRRWPIAVATATVIIAAALPFLVLSDTDEEDAPANSAAANGWSRVLNEHDVFGGTGHQRIAAIAQGGPGFVAVGSDNSLGSERGAVWTSIEGSTWSRVPDEATDFGTADDETMRDVTAGGPGLVAVGSVCRETDVEYYEDGDQEEYCVGSHAAVWTSEDGVNWARVPHDDSIFGGDGEQEIASVTAGGPGLVAVGTERLFEDYAERFFDAPDAETAIVWTSVDGTTWSRVPRNDAVFGEATMQSVAVGGPGLVAVGSARFANGSIEAMWTSRDGIGWARQPYTRKMLTAGWPGLEVSDVTAGGPGLVAVGGPESAAFVWTSADGINWSQLAHDADFIGPGDQSMRSVIAGGPGLVAVGTEAFRVPWSALVDGQSSHEQIAVVWTSRDGITWLRVPHNESVFGGGDALEMVDVVALGSNLIAVGSVCVETEVSIDEYREEGCVDVDAVVWKTNN